MSFDGIKQAFETASGEVAEGGLFVRFGGLCPVQGYGEVDGRACYYRSRGDGWQFEVYAPDVREIGYGVTLPEPTWEYAEEPYEFPEGGYVGADTSRACILKAVAAWRAAGRP